MEAGSYRQKKKKILTKKVRIAMIDPKMRSLIWVVEEGGYTRAARALHLTQPAVSHHIRQLEAEYGLAIFRTDRKELLLTPEGEVLVKYARRALALERAARQAIEDSRRSLQRLTVGLTPTAGEYLMPQVLALYSQEHPETHINIITDSINNLYSRMDAYELDLAVVEGALPGGKFCSVLLDTDYLCLIVSPQHPFARRQSVRTAELKAERMVMRTAKAGTRALFDSYLQSQGESVQNFNVVMELDNVTMIKELVGQNLGVSIIAKSACRAEERAGQLVAVPIENASMSRNIHLIYHGDMKHPEVLEALRGLYNRIR